MRAVRFHDRHDIRFDEVAAPGAPGPHEVVVKPSYCGICGSDLHEYLDGPILPTREPHVFTGAKMPQILGHEFGGTVEAVGSAVTNVKVGDRVSIQPQMAPDDEYYGRRKQYHLSPKGGVVGLSYQWGGMSDLAIVNDYNAFLVPDDVTDIQASLVEPAAVAVHAVDRADVKQGDSVLISGYGPIGALCALAAKAAGAGQIFITETNPKRLDMARALFPDAILVNPREQDLPAIVRDNTEEGIGVHSAIECAGVGAALNGCVAVVRRQGTIVQIGLQTHPVSVDLLAWTFRDLIVRGSICYPSDSWPRVMELIAGGKFPVEKIVTDIVPLDDAIERGFKPLLDPAGDQLKILLKI
ncbi:MAG: 2,3-butanediol dehydrogenase [Rhizobiaceae bacterium]|nr:2,3-butanediol dehydrogenase [Rhizobiaceae bacterium]